MTISSNITGPLTDIVVEAILDATFNNESDTNASTLLTILDLDYETANIRMLVFTMICAIVVYFTFIKTLSFCMYPLKTAIKICLYTVAVIPVITGVMMLYFWARGDAPDRIDDIVKVAAVLNITKADIINKIPFI